ncbi:MAG: PAS domain S-box protein, partial [Candidatus Binataceae bacterium]
MSSDRPVTAVPEDAVLRAIVQGVEAETGERFFASLVQNLALALSVQYAFVTQLSDDGTRFKMLAVWERDHFGASIELPLHGTPCESVLHGQVAHHAEGLCALFPEDKGLVDWRAESYCGVPVFDSEDQVFGHVAILDDKPMPDGSRGIEIMRIFASRVRAEIERLRLDRALRLSEQRYRDLYESAPVPFVSATQEGRLVRWNRQFVEWSGYTADQLKKMNASAFAPESGSERELFLQRYASIVAGNEATYNEQAFRLADGSLAWASVSTRLVRDQSGGIIESQTILSDITDRIHAEQALQESEARYRDLYEGAPSPIVSATPDGRFVRWNERFLEWSGYTAEQMRSISLRDFWPESRADQAEIEEANRRWHNLERFETEFQLRIAGGAQRWVHAALRPVLNSAGEMEMSEVILIDITDRKAAEEALRISEERVSRVIDSAMDAIITFDPSHRIELFNEAAENIFRLPAGKAIGSSHNTVHLSKRIALLISNGGGGGSPRRRSGKLPILRLTARGFRRLRLETTRSCR